MTDDDCKTCGRDDCEHALAATLAAVRTQRDDARNERDALRADLDRVTCSRDELRESVREHLATSGYLTDDRAGPLEAVEDAGDLLKRLAAEVATVRAAYEADARVNEICGSCGGHGGDARSEDNSPCPRCNGVGYREVRAPLPEASEAVRQMVALREEYASACKQIVSLAAERDASRRVVEAVKMLREEAGWSEENREAAPVVDAALADYDAGAARGWKP